MTHNKLKNCPSTPIGHSTFSPYETTTVLPNTCDVSNFLQLTSELKQLLNDHYIRISSSDITHTYVNSTTQHAIQILRDTLQSQNTACPIIHDVITLTDAAVGPN